METIRSVLDVLRPHATALAVGAACATGLYALSLPRPYYDFNKVCGQFDATNLSQDPYFFDNTQFEWVPMVEAGWRTVREELEIFLQRKELIPYFGENLMTRKQCWKVLGLKFWGLNHTEHQKHFPRTMELLNKVPGLSLVAFSQIEPGSAITPHNGDTNANIRCHLGLVVPGELPQIGFRVGTEERSWHEGEVRERGREMEMNEERERGECVMQEETPSPEMREREREERMSLFRQRAERGDRVSWAR
jgi:hypothetical protein